MMISNIVGNCFFYGKFFCRERSLEWKSSFFCTHRDLLVMCCWSGPRLKLVRLFKWIRKLTTFAAVSCGTPGIRVAVCDKVFNSSCTVAYTAVLLMESLFGRLQGTTNPSRKMTWSTAAKWTLNIQFLFWGIFKVMNPTRRFFGEMSAKRF